ncbi:protein amalgam-like isoform X2 [Pecten maximus]|uniref:protein amalgam-like isoform X2 n=1 Tax=Pecten maximus TaxID=6579 RepID=UPI001458A243|nr:protein amalgam-like isoform X2 [Pecten maximus]
MWSLYCLLPLLFAVVTGGSGPVLDQNPITVNIIAGYTAVLPCTVKNKDPRTRVLWIGPSGVLLTMNKDTRTTDERISLRSPYEDDWNLRIEQVKYSDRGDYKCKLATSPAQVKVATLNVLLSPKILTEYSSRDMVVREGSDLELVCNATGVPHPEITWYRKQKDTPNAKTNLGTGNNDRLLVTNVTRDQAGTYECVARNDVEPADTIAIKVDVQFAPEIDIGVDTLSQKVGKSTALECVITGFPMEVAVWRYNGIDIEERTWKYEPIVFQRDENTILLSLEIRDLNPNDFGVYTCYASNVLGSANRTIFLKEIRITTPLPLKPKPTTTFTDFTSTTTGATTRSSSSVLISTTTNSRAVISDKNPPDGPTYTLNPPGTEGQSNSCATFRYESWTFLLLWIPYICFI